MSGAKNDWLKRAFIWIFLIYRKTDMEKNKKKKIKLEKIRFDILI